MSLYERMAHDKKIHRQETEKDRCLRSLMYLCTEKLGYDKLSESFHGPMLADWDRIDLARFKGQPIDTLDLWPRDHIKTWCERARVLRYYLYDPAWTHTWWHSVEEMAQESAVAIGKVIQTNGAFRSMMPPESLPSRMAKRFVGGSGFALRSNRIGDAPSMRAWGAGSEATGGHSRGATLDDPIGLNDIVDSQMPTKRRWYQATVCNVVRSDGWKDGIGTRWDRDDLYSDWLRSPNWVSRVRACLETDGKPDYKGTPTYLTMAEIDKKRHELGSAMFSFQMMNDPSPAGLRAWDPVLCERFVVESEFRGGITICLSDPAPAHLGSFKDPQAKAKGYETKNEWAIAIVRLRKVGIRNEAILLDLAGSKDWDLREGYRRIFAMMRKWGCSRLAEEQTGQAIALYEDTRRAVAREEGAKYRAVKLAGTYRGQAKKTYFAALCSKAKDDEFLIAETVPPDELDPFIEQCRNCVFLGDGFRNNLKLDDRMNVVSFLTDPEVARLTPLIEEEKSWSPFSRNEPELESTGSRYVRW